MPLHIRVECTKEQTREGRTIRPAEYSLSFVHAHNPSWNRQASGNLRSLDELIDAHVAKHVELALVHAATELGEETHLSDLKRHLRDRLNVVHSTPNHRTRPHPYNLVVLGPHADHLLDIVRAKLFRHLDRATLPIDATRKSESPRTKRPRSM